MRVTQVYTLKPHISSFFTVIFDPASFYGHSEYDLAISKMFGGFASSFFDSYHKLVPQDGGFRRRLELYKLFHYLNHWWVRLYYLSSHPVFSGVRVIIFSFRCMFCRSLFVLLYFFFWPLYCLFFFDIQILITPLVSSNSSF